MLRYRIIPCLDVDAGRVVKGRKFVGLQDVGDPAQLAREYNEQGADELVFLDITASSDGRSIMEDVVRRVSSEVFIPLCVGGGIRSIEDMRRMLQAGADKVSLNTAAVNNPELIRNCSDEFGAQCVVLAIDAKRVPTASDSWDVWVRGGRTHRDLDVVEWAIQGEELGAGEILLTSMDTDGERGGYDAELIKTVARSVTIPVIASGGAGSPEHLKVALNAGASAVLLASILHFGTYSVSDIKNELASANIPVRIT